MSELSLFEGQETQIMSDNTANLIQTFNDDKQDQHLGGMLSFLKTSDIDDSADDTIKFGKNAEFDEHQNSMIIPAKRNTKSYEQDKIKLLSESQRLIRETRPEVFKYKPPQYKTFGAFKNAIQSKKPQSNNSTEDISNKENLVRTTRFKAPLSVNDTPHSQNEVKSQNESLGSDDVAKTIANLLRKKNNNATGVIHLKSKEENENAAKNREELLLQLKKNVNRTVNTTAEESFTDLSTIVKDVDPTTGVVSLTSKIITVKKYPNAQFKNSTRGLDPNVATQIQSQLSAEDRAKWNTMSSDQQLKYHHQIMLKVANEKRRENREKRMKDMPVIDAVKKDKEKKDNDGLSDDDAEWVDDNEDNSGDSDEDTTDSDSDEIGEEDEAMSDDDVGVRRVKNTSARIISDDDEDDEESEAHICVEPVVDAEEVLNTVNDLTLGTSFSKDSAVVISPVKGLRERKRCEMSPKLVIDKTLLRIQLPERVSDVIKGLKTKYGLANKLNGVESSVLLLPTMKTTTTCIESLFKEQIKTNGQILEETLAEYSSMLSTTEPQMRANWKDRFNLLTSLCRDENRLAAYSFVNVSVASANSTLNSTDPALLVDSDDTIVMEPDTPTIIPATELMIDDGASDTTVPLLSNENSRDNTDVNEIHAKLFSFEDDSNDSTSKLAKNVFLKLSAFMKDTEEDIDDVDNNSRHKMENGGMEEEKDEENSDIDDVDLDESDNEVNEKSEVELDEEDEEEMLRKNIQSGRKFIPKEYIDEEAELSGSDAEDYGSDEDEHGMDEYEDEEGDLDKLPSAGKLRRQIERIHNKLEIDKDAHDIRYLKEMYLEDGDLNIGDDGPRKRRFAWDNLNDNEEFSRLARHSDDEDDEGSDYEDQALTAVAEERVSDIDQSVKEEEAQLFIKKFDKVLLNSLVGHKPDLTQQRSAWNTDFTTPVAVASSMRPKMQKFGSMLNKNVRSFDTAKEPSKTMNDFDLKSRMSVMYSKSARSTDAIKRSSSIVQPTVTKKQKTDE